MRNSIFHRHVPRNCWGLWPPAPTPLSPSSPSLPIKFITELAHKYLGFFHCLGCHGHYSRVTSLSPNCTLTFSLLFQPPVLPCTILYPICSQGFVLAWFGFLGLFVFSEQTFDCVLPYVKSSGGPHCFLDEVQILHPGLQEPTYLFVTGLLHLEYFLFLSFLWGAFPECLRLSYQCPCYVFP